MGKAKLRSLGFSSDSAKSAILARLTCFRFPHADGGQAGIDNEQQAFALFSLPARHIHNDFAAPNRKEVQIPEKWMGAT